MNDDITILKKRCVYVCYLHYGSLANLTAAFRIQRINVAEFCVSGGAKHNCERTLVWSYYRQRSPEEDFVI